MARPGQVCGTALRPEHVARASGTGILPVQDAQDQAMRQQPRFGVENALTVALVVLGRLVRDGKELNQCHASNQDDVAPALKQLQP
jgi:hypothetical protein